MLSFFRRFRNSADLNLPSRLDREVRDEIRFYLEMRVKELEADGMESEQAWKNAVESFGNLDEIVEETKAEREGGQNRAGGMEIVLSVWQDLGFAVRSLRKRPMFAIATLVSLGLGIGANTAVFSLLNSVLVSPLDVADPDRLLTVYTSQVGGSRYGSTSYIDYQDYRERSEVFSGLAAYTVAPMAVRGDGESRVRWGQLVSWDYFTVLGVEPVLGRSFRPEEDETFGAFPVAVLSFSTWRGQFGSDPEVLGRTVRINDSPFTVIGVAPSGFSGLMPVVEPALWAPLAMVGQALPFSPNIESRIDPWLQLVGRLADGVTPTDAQTALDVLAANLATEFPQTNRNKGIVTGELDAGRLGSPEGTNGASRVFMLLLAVVGFVLLVACFNVANLQLAKAAGRRKEIALRYSLGATRMRIVRQLLVESFLLALLAAGLGLVLAVFALDAVQLLQTQMEVPLQLPVSLDLRVLGFTAALAITTGLLFGLAPALQVLRPGQSEALKDQGHALSQVRRHARLQSTLVVAQVAISVVLLAGAGLFVRSLQHTIRVDPGFDLREGVVVSLNLGYGQYDESQGRELQQRLLDRFARMPGVESAALTSFMPLGISHGHHDVFIDGYEPSPDEFMLVKRNMVSPGYFDTMGIRVLRGRAIDERDTEDSEPVAMVNETMAQRFWPGSDPIGRTVRADMGITYTVIGIVEDGKYGALLESPESYLVLPRVRAEYVEMANLVVRANGDARMLARELEFEVRNIAPDLPPPTVMTIPDYLDFSLGNARTPALLVGVFGLLAFVLASIGLYGMMSYGVSQRTREFGVRLALGASTTGVVRMVLKKGLQTTVVGIVVGMLLAFAGTRVLSGMLYGIGALDPIVFTVVPAVFLLVGQLASYLPARHASKADPVVVLRAE
jgi:macrolide transport system ATP-binding/permease protein